MKRGILFSGVFLTLSALYILSCNTIEGSIEQTPIDLTGLEEGNNATETESYGGQSLVHKQDSVLICNSKTSYAYHSGYCTGLKKCKAGVRRVLKTDAEAQGKKDCGYCYK